MNIPIDLPLPLPGPLEALKVLLVITFIVHILFVGLMVGGTYWSVLFRLIAKIPGREDAFYERLARETLSTVTVNKSIAVVLGVAPLLLIGLAYTQYWYSATMITAPAFLSIVWLVILAFLLLYAYKYSWDFLEKYFLPHLALGVAAAGIFSIVPLIFLANINLMLLPARWEGADSFLNALLLPNVLFRYFHFLVAVCAMIGFFAAIYFWYRGRQTQDPFYRRAQNLGLKWALGGTLLQGIFGPLLFVTLPDGSYSIGLLVLIGISISLAAIVCIVLIRALRTTSGASVTTAVLLLGVIALLMSFQRHIVRENLLREPQLVAEQRTSDYRLALASFMETYTSEGAGAATGETLFTKYCTSCHARDRRLVGPPVSYMVDKYEDDRDAMVQFVLNPKKVDPDYPAMPKPPAGEGEVEKIVDYILTGEETPSGEETPGGEETLTGEGTPTGEEAPNGAEAPNGDEKPSENE